MSGDIKYFAYGANRELEMMKAITGSSVLKGEEAVLPGYELHVQKLNQVPNIVVPNAPRQVSPRGVLKRSWDDSFESYVATPGSGKIAGTLWKLTEEERELVRHWELIYFGWYQQINVEVNLEGGSIVQAETEILGPGQETDRKVDGMNYPSYLMDKQKIFAVAKRSRKAYYERMEQK